jgi:hypothetical protein
MPKEIEVVDITTRIQALEYIAHGTMPDGVVHFRKAEAAALLYRLSTTPAYAAPLQRELVAREMFNIDIEKMKLSDARNQVGPFNYVTWETTGELDRQGWMAMADRVIAAGAPDSKAAPPLADSVTCAGCRWIWPLKTVERMNWHSCPHCERPFNRSTPANATENL